MNYEMQKKQLFFSSHQNAKTKARIEAQKAMIYPFVPEELTAQVPPRLSTQLSSVTVQAAPLSLQPPAVAVAQVE